MSDEPTATGSIDLEDGRRIEAVVDEGFGGMVDAFVANFARTPAKSGRRGRLPHGRLVVDLWGGLADPARGRALDGTTRRPSMFSCTKGVLAICAYLLVQDGRLDLDAAVSRYWPAFGQQRQAAIPVRGC